MQGERGGAIFAIEMRDTERMRYTDRPDYIISPLDPWEGEQWTPWWHDAGSRSNPAEWAVPLRNAQGDLIQFDNVWYTHYNGAYWGADGTYDYEWDIPLGHSQAAMGAQIFGPGDPREHLNGRVVALGRNDPGCGYGFGAGHDDFGPVDPAWADLTYQERIDSGITTYNDLQKPGNFLNGMTHAHQNIYENSERCIMSLSDMQDLQAEAELRKGMAYFEYELTDYVKLRGEIVLSQNDYTTRDVTGATDEADNVTLVGSRTPIVIGDNPGNPFRAFADGSGLGGFAGVQDGYLNWDDNSGLGIDGDGLYQYGLEPGEAYLFAQDANGDGIPDRDFNGDNIADVGAQLNPIARVILLSAIDDTDGDGVADRFDQDTLGNGGVRLFEDVRARWGEWNVHPKNPRNNTNEWAVNDGGALVYKRRFVRDNVRLRVGTEISIPNTDWIIDADYVWSEGHRSTNYPEPLIGEYVAALRCQGGPNGDSCLNPFTTSYLNTTADGQLTGDESIKFPDANDPGWRPFYDANGDISSEVNSELENRNAGIIIQYNLQDLGMKIFDVVASTGSLFEIPWNDMPVGFAIGGHWREESEEWRPNSVNAASTGGGKIGLRESEQETQAVFAEFQLPLLEHETWGSMELQLASRYAEIETRGIVGQTGSVKFSTTIPKIALRYAPTQWLSLRTSKTEGFVTPGLFAMFGESGQYGNVEEVSDYICDFLPEIDDCVGIDMMSSGSTPEVLVRSTPNRDLGAEVSDLWNAGFSLRLLEGDMVIDVDYTTVDFDGRSELIGANVNVRKNQLGFENYLVAACPGTVPDWDNENKWTEGDFPAEFLLTDLTAQEYKDLVGQVELDCRLAAAMAWVATDANSGNGELPLGLSILERGNGANGLRLSEVEEPWVEQGRMTTQTVIYALRYSFDGEQIPFIGGDYGTFAFNLSATQMLESSLIRYTSTGCDEPLANGLCPGDNPLAGIKVDGVGNRNGTSYAGPGEGLYAPLAPAPEWRVSMGLRWYRGNHTLQLMGRWHDSVTNLNIAWDEQKLIPGQLSEADALIEEKDRCSKQPANVCKVPSAAYWDVSYSYSMPDFMGMNLDVNVAVRNVFDKMPAPQLMPAGHEGYLDNVMGRIGFARLSLSL